MGARHPVCPSDGDLPFVRSSARATHEERRACPTKRRRKCSCARPRGKAEPWKERRLSDPPITVHSIDADELQSELAAGFSHVFVESRQRRRQPLRELDIRGVIGCREETIGEFEGCDWAEWKAPRDEGAQLERSARLRMRRIAA